jgi:hypothetical protein
MRMHVPLATLGTLLDFPAGVSVVGVSIDEQSVGLYLDGVHPDQVPGYPTMTDEEVAAKGRDVSAEYSVDVHGRRSFVRFKGPEPEPAAPEDTGDQEPAQVTETVGTAEPANTAPPSTTGAPPATTRRRSGSGS